VNPKIRRSAQSVEDVYEIATYLSRDFMIFYHPLSNGIEIVRVLHGARDIESLFE